MSTEMEEPSEAGGEDEAGNKPYQVAQYVQGNPPFINHFSRGVVL